jgi:Rrf2 family protein
MLTQKARYALQAMLHLARVSDSVTVAAIAEAEGIPRKFLEQVMSALKARGLVVSRRGAQGGYLLGRPADAVTFADILRCIDGPLALAPCVSQTAFHPCEGCADVTTCLIRPALLAVRDTTAILLEGYTLAQALGDKRVAFV